MSLLWYESEYKIWSNPSVLYEILVTSEVSQDTRPRTLFKIFAQKNPYTRSRAARVLTFILTGQIWHVFEGQKGSDGRLKLKIKMLLRWRILFWCIKINFRVNYDAVGLFKSKHNYFHFSKITDCCSGDLQFCRLCAGVLSPSPPSSGRWWCRGPSPPSSSSPSWSSGGRRTGRHSPTLENSW